MKAKVSRGQAELPYFIDSKLHQRKEALFFSVLPVKLGQRKGEKTILRNLSNGIARSGMRMLLFWKSSGFWQPVLLMRILYIFLKCEMVLPALLLWLAIWQTFQFLLFSHFPSSQDHQALILLLHLLHLTIAQLVRLPLWCTHSLQVRQYLLSCPVTFKSKVRALLHTQKHCACSLGLQRELPF